MSKLLELTLRISFAYNIIALIKIIRVALNEICFYVIDSGMISHVKIHMK